MLYSRNLWLSLGKQKDREGGQVNFRVVALIEVLLLQPRGAKTIERKKDPNAFLCNLKTHLLLSEIDEIFFAPSFCARVHKR